MIALPAGTNIWIAAGVTDLRRGFTGLRAATQTVLEQDPYSGHMFVFRGRRGDLIKLLWWDGDGLCLFAKRLERGRFIWPKVEQGAVSLSRAQLSMLLEGIDWRHPSVPMRRLLSYKTFLAENVNKHSRHRQVDATLSVEDPHVSV
jgi:transposase